MDKQERTNKAQTGTEVSEVSAALYHPLAMTEQERQLLQPAQVLTVSQWAERYRQLSAKTSDIAGSWSHEYTPYLVEIMDKLSDATTRQVTLAKCSQSGGTEAALNFLGWVADQSPGPVLMVMPTENDSRRRVATRIKPMFEATPCLMEKINGKIDAINVGRESTLANMILYLGWAGSPAALADNPVCYVILDEVGKFPMASGKEADPVSLAKKRQRTFFWRSKLFVNSTPVLEDDLIDREFKAGDQRQWWVKCPHCGSYHVMAWANVIIDRDPQGGWLAPEKYTDGRHVHYVCPGCGVEWSEFDRWQAVRQGRWCPDGCSVNDNGDIDGDIPVTTHHSYHISAMMLHPRFQSLGDLARQWVQAQTARRTGDIGPLQDFINSQLGEPWVEAQKQHEIELLRSHIGSYPPEIVPAGVQMLTAGIDVQLDHLYVMLLGWGYMSEAWTIFQARLESGATDRLENYELLLRFLHRNWPVPSLGDGYRMPLRLAAIDCQYNTDTIYDLCRLSGQVPLVPVRGDDSVNTRLYRAGKAAGGVLVRYDLNVTVLKDRLYRLMYASQPGPGYMHLHSQTNDEVLAHLTSEELRVVRTGRKQQNRWQLKKQHLPNHYWDCCVYATFAAEIAGVRLIADPQVALTAGRRVGKLKNIN